jgi:putative transposase
MARIAPAERPHYQPTERLRILQHKAARGWNNEQAARAFLVTSETLSSWMRRLDEEGPDALVRMHEPVNRFPDFVRQLTQQLKATCPTLGKVRIAQLLARAGLHLGATTVGRFLKAHPVGPEPPGRAASEQSPDTAPKTDQERPTRKGKGLAVIANYPDHVWGVDLTVVPTAAGFWVPWIPWSALLCWPFCWWVSLVVDHFSRKVMGWAVYRKEPTAQEVSEMLDRAVAKAGRAPKYAVSDQGTQFGADYLVWCNQRGVKPRFGAIGQHGSIALLERFVRTLKQECCAMIGVPYSLDAMQGELVQFFRWYCDLRPHQSLRGATPAEVYEGRKPANQQPRLEPRARYPARSPCAAPRVPAHRPRGAKLRLAVKCQDGARHLPIVELTRVA